MNYDDIFEKVRTASEEDRSDVLFRLLGYLGSRANSDREGKQLAIRLLNYIDEIRDEQIKMDSK